MRIWKRAAWRKKLLKSSSEFSAIQEDSLLRLGILFLSCLCDCWAGVSPLRERQGGNENRRSLRSPPTPLCGAHAHAWLLSWQGKSALAGVNPAIIALLWGSPHADGCKNHPNCDQKMKNPRKRVIMLALE